MRTRPVLTASRFCSTGPSNMEKQIELVHFQLTKNCNLRCWFCGQWGSKGFFSDSKGLPMSFDGWKQVADQLVEYGDTVGALPDIMLWGGEPLMAPYFDDLVLYLRQKGFSLGMVTNGVLLNKHAKLIREEFKHVYVSVDGDKACHDAVRGVGVFDRVAENLKQIHGGKAYISLMCVISESNIQNLDQIPAVLSDLSCDEIILQEMIGLTLDEIFQYKQWMETSFNIQATDIEGWENTLLEDKRKDAALQRIMGNTYRKPIKYIPHGICEQTCQSPYSHIHIAWNGNLLYCTDFYDFTAGNVHNAKITDIFENELSQQYRKEIENEQCVTCKHCSWRRSTSFRI